MRCNLIIRKKGVRFMLRLTYILTLVIIFAITIGCSGGRDITMPEEPPQGPSQAAASTNAHRLFGLFQFTYDPMTGEVDIVPLRAADFHLNVLPFLEPPPFVNVTLESLEIDGNIVEAGIGLVHPFADATEFAGFDVCGILITKGSVSGFSDPSLRMTGSGDTRLLNPDGYARWWNPLEFPGNPDGLLGTPDSLANYNCTINGYKYYSDELDADDDISEVPISSRGLFSPGVKNVRNFIIELGGVGLVFNYAVDACWDFPTGSGPWTAPGDFPPEANRTEAWRIDVTEIGNTLYFDGYQGSGELHLSIDVYDWFDAGLNTVKVESPGNFIAMTVSTPDSTGDGYATYLVDVTDASPAAPGEIDILISIVSEEEDFGGFIPGTNTTAYFTHSTTVAGDVPHYIELLDPNGGQQWGVGSSHNIRWKSEGITGTVFIEYSKDEFVSDINTIVTDEYNDGDFPWETPDDPSTTVRVRVSSTDDPGTNDQSDEDFTIISGPWIEVLFPNGNQEWGAGSHHDITWDSYNITGTVFIQYSKDGFVSDLNTIATGEPNDGSCPWTTPYDPSTTVRVRVSSTSAPGVNDISDADFTIFTGPWIEILTPNGGEEWSSGSSREITWDSMGISGNIKIDYSTDNFISDIHSIATDEPNDGSYTWDYLPYDPSNTARVRVSTASKGPGGDISDGDFELQNGWARTWGGEMNDSALQTAVDNSGNIYVTGSFAGQVDFDPGSASDFHLSQSTSNAFLCKFDSNGDFQWARTWGGTSLLIGNGVAVFNNDNVYTTGYFYSNVDFDPDPDDEDIHMSNGGPDAYLTKFDSSGDFIWARTWGGDSSDSTSGLSVDASGNIYVPGGFWSAIVDFDPSGMTDYHTSEGSCDAYLSKFSPTGDFIWARTWGGAGYDTCNGAAVDNSNNIYLVGTFEGTVDFDPGSGTFNGISLGSNDAFLSKFTSSGNFQWSLTWGGIAFDYSGRVATDGFSNIYVIGSYNDTVDFDPGPGTDNHTSNGYDKAFLSKFDLSGDFQWALTWGGEENGLADIAQNDSDSVFVTGRFTGTTDFNPGLGTAIVSPNGLSDAYISKIDSSGSFQWVRTWGGADHERALAVAVDDLNILYIAGNFADTVDFNPGEGYDNRTSNGISDCYLMKLLPDGYW